MKQENFYDYSYIPLSDDHFPLLLKWLSSPHVKLWWDTNINWTMEKVHKKYLPYTLGHTIFNGRKLPIQAFIIKIANAPVGYIQIYRAHDFICSSILDGLPQSLAVLDFYSGDEHVLGKGYGASILKCFIQSYGSCYTHILADPDIDNQKAIRTFKNAGFTVEKIDEINHVFWMIKKIGQKIDNNKTLNE